MSTIEVFTRSFKNPNGFLTILTGLDDVLIMS